MVTTPELPLKLRRKGCPDFYVQFQVQDQDQDLDSDFDMAYSSPLSTAYSSFSDFDNFVPRSPTFCSSSSSAAPSSPIRALFTPEPPSSPMAEPHIASSPKSFWEVAINYGPELPYKIKARPAEQPYLKEHRNRMGCRTISRPIADELPPRGASVDTDEGEIDVASVLLDLKRRVRVSPFLSEPPKRTAPECVSPPEQTPPLPPAVNDVNGVLHPKSSTEANMEVDGAPAKLDEHEVCNAIDTNQPILDSPATSLDPCELQTSEPAAAATVDSDISAEHASPLPPLISQIDATRVEESAPIGMSIVDDAEPIVDVEQVDAAVAVQCPTLEPLDEHSNLHLALPNEDNRGTPALSDPTELTLQVLSPLSSPTDPFSFRPSSPIFGPVSPIAEKCEDNGRVLDSFLLGKNESCEPAELTTPPPCEMPIAGPSKPLVTLTEVKSVPSKRKHEDDDIPSLDPTLAQTDSTVIAPGKEKKKRQRKPKHDETLPFGDVAPTDVPKPRKRQPKKQKDTNHEITVLAPSIGTTAVTASDHDWENTLHVCHTDTKHPSKSNTTKNKSSVPYVREEIIVDPTERAELAGLLVQAMALSRASSMPASSLHRELLRENPHLSDRREKHLWIALIDSVLSSHSYFGRIERKGLDADDKPLEAQWFYMPEKDVDQERAMLLKEMMPKKRSATKTHKQYFYKPLGKISRWDPEDAL